MEQRMAMKGPWPRLLSSGKIGAMELKNRMIVTAMGVSLGNDDGTVSERQIAYHEEQAKGGAGLIISGVCGVGWPSGAVARDQLGISDDRFLPGLKEMVDRVHAHGGKIAAQLHHGGQSAGFSSTFGQPLWLPSAPKPFQGDFIDNFLPEELSAFAGGPMPEIKVMEAEDIQAAIRLYADGARRAKEAGFDGIEIHGAHGYLISSFLSPSSNRRTDEYGGPLENRARFMLDVARAVREAVGPDFAVWMKLDSREVGKEIGTTLEDARQVAQWLEAAGMDAITVSAYHNVGQGKLHSDSNIPHLPNTNVPAAEAIKAQVNIPIIASGRIEPDDAESHIAASKYDFLAMGRKILADPHLPRKLAEGRPDLVRPCIYCYTCVSAIYVRQQVRCAVNFETGFEDLRPNARPPQGKRVVVVGGGPGGMEAARRLDAAGNKVTLIEKSDRLGGTLRFASLAYEPNQRLLNWLRDQIADSGVEVRLKTEATPDLVKSLQPDAVYVATGAVRDMPPIPGNDMAHVLSGDDLRRMMLGETSEEVKRKTSFVTRLASKIGAATGMTANIDFVRKATHQWMPLGDRVAIIGGELVGLELAEFLMERGRKVTVIEEGPKFGRGLLLVRRMRIVPELREHGVALHANAKNVLIVPEGVQFTDDTGQAHSVAADHVIVARGAHGDSTVANQLRAAGLSVYEFGDGTGVGYIEGAIRGAAEAVTHMGTYA